MSGENMEEEEDDATSKWPYRGPGLEEEEEEREAHDDVEEEYCHKSSRGAPEWGGGGTRVRNTGVTMWEGQRKDERGKRN